MKHSKIALAVFGACASLSVLADSENVEIYGKINMSVESISAKGASTPVTYSAAFTGMNGSTPTFGTVNIGGQNTPSMMRVTDNASNLGFKGREDLGNGLEAIWQIESAISPDGSGLGTNNIDANGTYTSNSSTKLGSSTTFVGLKSDDYGQVRLGHLPVYYHEHLFVGDLAGGKSSISLTTMGLFNSAGEQYVPFLANAAKTGVGGSAGYIGGRLDNVLEYTTPKFGGFQFRAAYATAENKSTNGTNERTWALHGGYNSGPFALGLDYIRRLDGATVITGSGLEPGHGSNGSLGTALADMLFNSFGTRHIALDPNGTALSPSILNANATVGGGNQSTQTGVKLSASYLFNGATRIGFIVERVKYNANPNPKLMGLVNKVRANGYSVNLAPSRTAWALTASHSWGKNNVYATYGRAGNLSGTTETGSQYLGLSYAYDLSKRTTLYASYAQFKNQKNAAYNFFINGRAPGVDYSGNNSSTFTTARGSDPRSIQIGIQHTF
ncbi:porin [Leeia aquatica]|uniref:Porin n=1 Tax=Leeia aquatica TaxID=2725557 RepID=A0A847S850_9NEIS|nr:porin [Leeia aquatica]NLR73806.1 porin [Leeia aquatica]